MPDICPCVISGFKSAPNSFFEHSGPKWLIYMLAHLRSNPCALVITTFHCWEHWYLDELSTFSNHSFGGRVGYCTFVKMLLALALFTLSIKMGSFEPLLRSCEPIRVELCTGLGYNVTGMPNLGGNELQQDADYTLKTFSPLIQYGCSSQLKLFLCSVYVPMCTEKVANPIGPCRGLCENVRSRCYPVLQGFGFPWPDALNCSRFPEENNHEHMCMEGPKDMGIDITAPVVPAIQSFDCPPNHVKTEPSGSCVPICGSDFLFDSSEKKLAEVWITVWTITCFVCSLGAVLTLSIGGGRVRSRPLISLALCYCFISSGLILRIIVGRSTTSCQSGITSGDSQGELHEDGLGNPNCAFVFLFLYYFGMAADLWWVCLCGWWVARAGLSWPPEKLRNLGSFLHVAAWGLPAAQTVAALVRRDVDADELTGTCYVGNKDSTTLLALVLVPQALYLTIGLTLLLIGCLLVIRKPHPLAAAPLTGAAPRKDSDLLGALCTLYLLPTASVFASVCYEYNNREKWLIGQDKPALWVFLLRSLMELFVGVSAIFWIWSPKSITAWKAVFKRLGPRKQLPVKCQTMPVIRYGPNHPPVPVPVPTSTLSTSSSRHSNRSHSHRKPRIHHHRNGGETVL